jgi:diguanylate cyclase
MTSTTDWREKYLDALDEHERQQKHHQQQHELMRRMLVRVSLAAEGQDPELDSGLRGLRGHLKKGDSAGLERVVEGLEAIVLRFEKDREQRAGRTLEELGELAKGLLPYAGQAAAEVKSFSKRLKHAADSDLPLLLSQFAELQQKAFSESGVEPAQGFIGRLLGRGSREQTRDDDKEASAPKSADKGSETPTRENTETTEHVSKEPDHTEQAPEQTSQVAETQPLEGQLQTREEVDEKAQKEAVFQRPVHEPAFSRISDKVFHVLTDLLDRVEPVDCTEQKALDARERLERGLNWYELVPTLEDIRDLVLQAYLLADEEYREHLKHLHGVLESILSGLGGTIDQQQQNQQLERQFEQTLQHQLGSLGQSVAVATEVNQLKQDINTHLQAINDALKKKQQARGDDDLVAQLKQLSQQLTTAQQQAASAREELEAARQKAVTDALTGLPNREAYNQRMHLEWSRWQRYGNALTVVVTDIDHFKRINDTYGHQAGDRVLQVLSKAISQRLREVDFMARYGGEEFVILLPETEPQDGFALMDKIRSVIAETPFRFKQDPVKVTLSMGIVTLKEGDTAEKAFARADKLLYRAKEEGRNRCILEE